VKFYILCNRNLEDLKDHVKTVPFKDQVVVINSQDDDFIDQASAYCQENSIEHYVTESDGTAATGKNSVMKLFLESDNEYMVQVDGDDQISEFGYQVYTDLAKKDDAPDLVILKNQQCWRYTRYSGKPDGTQKPIGHERLMPWRRFADAIEDQLSVVNTYVNLKDQRSGYKVSKRVYEDEMDDQLLLWAIDRVKFEEFFWRMGEGSDELRETFNRMVFYSRKTAELINFDNSLKVGEDTVEMLRMKKLCYDGKLNMKVLDEHPAGEHTIGRGKDIPYTYLYNQKDGGGQVLQVGFDYTTQQWNLTWMTTLMDYIEDHGYDEDWSCLEGFYLPEVPRKTFIDEPDI
jgi:hypothetical protein